MTVDKYITQYIAVVVPFMIGIFALYIAIRQDKDRHLVTFFDENITTRALAKSIYFSAYATDNAFGKTFVSRRSFFVSFIINLIAFFVFLILAVVSTHGLHIGLFLPVDIDTFIVLNEKYCKLLNCEYSIAPNFIITHYVILFSFLLENIFIDYLYTIKTRYLLRKIGVNDSKMRILIIIFLDFFLSALIFAVFFSALFIIATIIYKNIFAMENIEPYTLFNVINTFYRYLSLVWNVFTIHLGNYFNFFLTLTISIDYCYDECKPSIIAMLPITTFLATSFATSLWIVFYSFVLLSARLCARSFKFLRRRIMSVYNRPGQLVLWSSIASIGYLLFSFFFL